MIASTKLCHQRKTLKLMPAPKTKKQTTEQNFNFITVLSFISLISGNSVEPLYFVKLVSKGVAEKDISDPFGHFVGKGEHYFQGHYLKLCRSKDIKVKKFKTLPATIAITPDEVYDTYVDFNDELEIDCI